MSNTAFTDTVTYKEQRFKLFPLGARKIVSESLGSTISDSIKLDYHYDDVLQSMVCDLRAHVLATELASDTYTTYVESEHYFSWWDMFKKTNRWWNKLPKSFRDKHPIRRIKQSHQVNVILTRYATYPRANEAVRNDPSMFIRLGSTEVIKDIMEVKK